MDGTLSTAACKRNEMQVLRVLLFLIDSATDHECGAEECRGVVFQSDSPLGPLPLILFQVVNQQLVVEYFSVVAFETHTSHNYHAVFVDLDRVEAGRYFGTLALTTHLNPLPAF